MLRYIRNRRLRTQGATTLESSRVKPTYVDMVGVVSNSTRLRSSPMGPLPFFLPSETGFSDRTGILLNAVMYEGKIRVEANVALSAGSSKLRLVFTTKDVYQGIMRRASQAYT